MSRSLRVRQEYIEKVKLSVKRSGFPNQRALAEDLGMALATISKFLTGRPVDRATFVEICEKLSLDCETIATFPVEAGAEPEALTHFATPLPISTTPPVDRAARLLDWGDAIDVPVFYGRVEELATLEQWIVQERCRLVTLIGMGGIGKTTLSVSLARQIQGVFDCVIWRSLRNAPPIHDFLADLIRVLSHQQAANLSDAIDSQIARLIEYLRRDRCLLILDNAESLVSRIFRHGFTVMFGMISLNYQEKHG